MGGDECVPEITYYTKYGCEIFSYDKFAIFINNHFIIFGITIILLGVFFAFFGNKFTNAVIFIVAAFVTFMLLAYASFTLFDLFNTEADWIKWVFMLGCMIVGGIFGTISMRHRKEGISILAAWGGVMLGFMVTSSLVVESPWMYWLIIIAFALAAGGVAFVIEEKVIIACTSFIGSYGIIRGISLFAGGFPNESTLHKELASGVVTWETMNKAFYGYLAGILVLTILSIYYQVKHNKSAEANATQVKYKK